jgi:hypothetical protein
MFLNYFRHRLIAPAVAASVIQLFVNMVGQVKFRQMEGENWTELTSSLMIIIINFN